MSGKATSSVAITTTSETGDQENGGTNANWANEGDDEDDYSDEVVSDDFSGIFDQQED